MAQPTLKSLLGKRSDTTAWLLQWVETTKAEIVVEDAQHNMLYSSTAAIDQTEFPVILDDDVVGYVKGDTNAIVIAGLLSLMLQKEAEKKKLGTEVLHLYQELNVIYNFSEKLTETIDPDVIAQLTLEQAMHSIPSDSGVVVLWDDQSKQLTIPAITGEPLFDENNNLNETVGIEKIREYVWFTETRCSYSPPLEGWTEISGRGGML